MTVHSEKVQKAADSLPKVDREWDDPDVLWVPPTFVDRMRSSGFYIAWIRFTEGQDRPDRRLAQKFHQGWEFVKPESIPEWKMPPTIEHARFSHMIAVGDLALAMIPEKNFLRYKNLEDQRVAQQTQAIKNQLMAQSDRKMPISDSSKTAVTAGGRVTKFGD